MTFILKRQTEDQELIVTRDFAFDSENMMTLFSYFSTNSETFCEDDLTSGSLSIHPDNYQLYKKFHDSNEDSCQLEFLLNLLFKQKPEISVKNLFIHEKKLHKGDQVSI